MSKFFDRLRTMRQRKDATPVLMLSANFSVETRIGSLDEGADDYLVKPFDLRELGARVRALTRRGSEHTAPDIVVGDIALDPSAQTVRLRGDGAGDEDGETKRGHAMGFEVHHMVFFAVFLSFYDDQQCTMPLRCEIMLQSPQI